MIHVGDGCWVVIDSAISLSTRTSLPLQYLVSLGVNVAADVKLVVASHWHADHVRGIADLFKSCLSAKFVCSAALASQEFLTMVKAYAREVMIADTGMSEFVEVINELERRKPAGSTHMPYTFAVANREVWRTQVAALGGADCRVTTLTPADAAMMLSQFSLSNAGLIPGAPKLDVMAPKPNLGGVVVWVSVGPVNLLLGGDLEETKDPLMGWSGVLELAGTWEKRACFFKIPHHGSVTAHHDGVWERMLEESPLAVLTPFNRGAAPLPTTADVSRLCAKTSHAFATAPADTRRLARRDRVARELINKTARDIRIAEPSQGHVRVRGRVDEPFTSWSVELSGDSFQLSPTAGCP